MRQVGRRVLLQGVLALAGLAAAPVASAQTLFAGPQSLSPKTMVLLTAVADTLVPDTDTPGAAAAGAPEMFNKLMANWASAKQRALLLDALEAIDADAVSVEGVEFAALPADRRYQLLSAYDTTKAADPGYAQLKNLLVTLYYLTEAGATVELRYEHSPGAWEPSLEVTAETRNHGGLGAF